MSSFAHGTPGQCRRSGSRLPANATALNLEFKSNSQPTWSLPSQHDSAKFASLQRVLHLVAPPACGLTFLGDSVSHDTYMASLVGALHAGMTLEDCSWGAVVQPGVSTYLAAERIATCNGTDSWATSHLSDQRVGSSFQCARLIVRHVPFLVKRKKGDAMASPLEVSSWLSRLKDDVFKQPGSIVIMNIGLGANRGTDYEYLLENMARPAFDVAKLVPPRDRARLLWRETTPQHYRSYSGSGLYVDMRGNGTCAPIGKPASGEASADQLRTANWRNRQFERWSRMWRVRPAVASNPTRALLRNQTRVKARANSTWLSNITWGAELPSGSASLFHIILGTFTALVPRWDLHIPPDCTHYCFAAPLWEPLWASAAELLSTVAVS